MTSAGPGLEIRATSGNYRVASTPGEPLIETLRRAGLPAIAYLFATPEGEFQSLSEPVPADGLTASALRNPDFDIIAPRYELLITDDPIAEIFEYAGTPSRPRIRQLSRDDALELTYTSVEPVFESAQALGPIQIALSSGGDGRALAECANRYAAEHDGAAITAVITSTGFEDPASHINEAVAIAERFAIPYEVFDEDTAAAVLGYETPLESVAREFSSTFPQDELEVLGTYWVQEINVRRALQAERRSIAFGYNIEDVIADRLYQLLNASPLPAYPLRRMSAHDLVLAAPLHLVPKNVIDALDVRNSLRNYEARVPSGSYLRSALYFLAYHIVERFPPVAKALAGAPQSPPVGDDAVANWLGLR